MTHLQFRDRLADIMHACDRADRPFLATSIREILRELDAGLTESPPHPDTARADAAERMLAGVFKWAVFHNDANDGQDVGADLLAAVPGLKEWSGTPAGQNAEKRLRLAELQEQVATTERELEALTR